MRYDLPSRKKGKSYVGVAIKHGGRAETRVVKEKRGPDLKGMIAPVDHGYGNGYVGGIPRWDWYRGER